MIPPIRPPLRMEFRHTPVTKNASPRFSKNMLRKNRTAQECFSRRALACIFAVAVAFAFAFEDHFADAVAFAFALACIVVF